MRALFLIALLLLALSGCAGANIAANMLGGLLNLAGPGDLDFSSHDGPKASWNPSASHLVCNVPPGVEHPDPSVYCHSD